MPLDPASLVPATPPDRVNVDSLFAFRRPVGASQADHVTAVLTIQPVDGPALRVMFGDARLDGETVRQHRERLAMSVLEYLIEDVGSKLRG